jgi:hypothetical protein
MYNRRGMRAVHNPGYNSKTILDALQPGPITALIPAAGDTIEQHPRLAVLYYCSSFKLE